MCGRDSLAAAVTLGGCLLAAASVGMRCEGAVCRAPSSPPLRSRCGDAGYRCLCIDAVRCSSLELFSSVCLAGLDVGNVSGVD